MAVTAFDNLTLDLTEEIRVHASLAATFEALLEEMGPHNTGVGEVPMPMVIEPRPGGRWYRDLGDDNGHFWGHVQAIRRPTLLEITGPLFMYILAGLLVLGLVANALVKPLSARWFASTRHIPSRQSETPHPNSSGSFGMRAALAWTAVGVPLAWGTWVTLTQAVVLFGGR